MTNEGAGSKEARASRRVVIAGFMCAGKTTAARELARLLGRTFIDLDDLIAARAGRTPRRLIDEEGEARFRELETEALGEILEGDAPFVLALGGGTWALERNRTLIAARGCLTVWLDAPFELCWRRITNDGGDASRPLARGRESARRLHAERIIHYRLADLRVHAGEGRSPSSLAEEIAALVRVERTPD